MPPHRRGSAWARRDRWVAALFLWLLPVATLGCGSSASKGNIDAGVDAASPDGAAEDGDLGAADGLCNTLAQEGAPVAPVCDAGSPPAATGGAITDGTYVLTESHFFGDCSSAALTETLVVAQGTVQSITTTSDGAAQPKTVTYTLGSDALSLVETQTCPIKVLTTVRFSATPSTLTIYLSNALATRVSTFTLH